LLALRANEECTMVPANTQPHPDPFWAPECSPQDAGLNVAPNQYAGMLADATPAASPSPPVSDLWTDESDLKVGQPRSRRRLIAIGLGALILLLAAGAFVLWRPRHQDNGTTGSKPNPRPPDGVAGSNTDLIVSRTKEGRYPTIADAVRDAAPGARIRVKPGRYQGGVALDREVEIVADGPSGSVVLESVGYPCLSMLTDRARVSGLTLKTSAGTIDKVQATVRIGRGQLILEDCDISSDSETTTCVSISGEGTYPILRGCTIHDGRVGVFFYDGAAGRVEDCSIYAQSLSGITVRSESTPLVRWCPVYDCKTGFNIFDGGAGQVEHCMISHNGLGVVLSEGAHPVFRHCTVDHGKGSGVLVTADGAGELLYCDIRDNTRSGVVVSVGGHPFLEGCEIAGNRSKGVDVFYGGTGEFERCDIHDNLSDGVAVGVRRPVLDPWFRGPTPGPRSVPVLVHCTLRNNKGAGLFVYDEGAGHFESCTVSGHPFAEVVIATEGDPVLRSCTLHKGKQQGLVVRDKGKGTFIGCPIEGNDGYGVVLFGAAGTSLKRCPVKGNGKLGVWVRKMSRASIEGCDLGGNKGGPSWIEADCVVTESGNTPPLKRAAPASMPTRPRSR
jgi:hypothetical protein